MPKYSFGTNTTSSGGAYPIGPNSTSSTTSSGVNHTSSGGAYPIGPGIKK